MIDCFTFFNELDLLDVRLHHLYNYVDRFVIVEANRTHSGKPKPYILEQNFSRYEWALDKIDYIKCKLPETDNRWQLENAQRNAIINGIIEGIVLIGDLDEIPSIRGIENFTGDCAALEQKACCWYVNVCDPSIKWPGTVILKSDLLKQYTPQQFRDSRFQLPKIENGGYHFTYLGGIADYVAKIESFAHGEFDLPEYKDKFILNKNKELLLDPFSRNCYKGQIYVPDETFPQYLKENRESFKHFFK